MSTLISNSPVQQFTSYFQLTTGLAYVSLDLVVINSVSYSYKVFNPRLTVGTAPSGSSLVANIRVDGSTILDGNKIAIADGQLVSDLAVLTQNIINTGSRLSFDIDQRGAVNPGTNVQLSLDFMRLD